MNFSKSTILLSLFVIVLFAVSSCKKDNDEDRTPLTGTWKIKTIITSFTDASGKPFGNTSEETYADGEASILFTEDNKMYYTNNPDDDQASGVYVYDKKAATITVEWEVFHITELSSKHLNMYTNYTYRTDGQQINGKEEFICTR